MLISTTGKMEMIIQGVWGSVLLLYLECGRKLCVLNIMDDVDKVWSFKRF